MPYQYSEEIDTSYVAFRSWGDSAEELFKASADALINSMVADPDLISDQIRRFIDIEETGMDMLLFEFLQELIFFKDAAMLLLRTEKLEITEESGTFFLHAEAYGESLDSENRELLVDIKAVTMQNFQVKKTEVGWEAMVTLDR